MINTQGARGAELFDLQTDLDRGQSSVKDLISGVGASPGFEVQAPDDLTSSASSGLFMTQSHVHPQPHLSSLMYNISSFRANTGRN